MYMWIWACLNIMSTKENSHWEKMQRVSGALLADMSLDMLEEIIPTNFAAGAGGVEPL